MGVIEAGEGAELDTGETQSPSCSPSDTPPAVEAASSTTSYEEVYRAEYARLIRVAFMLSGSNEVAEDVVQDAFVRLYTRFDDVAEAGSYLYRSVVNGCWSRHRHARVVERLRHLTSSNGVSTDEVDETSYLLERLAPRQRTVVVLRYYADLSLGDIAEILGVTTGTVKSTLHRALSALREVVEP